MEALKNFDGFSLLALVFGLVAGYFLRRALAIAVQQHAERRREEILGQAKREAEQLKKEIEVEGKEEVIALREDFEEEVQEIRGELRQTERRLEKREDSIEKKQELVAKKERYLETSEKNLAENRRKLAERENEVEELVQKQRQELHRISGLSQDDAKELLLERIEQDMEQDCVELIGSKVAQANEKADMEAQAILVEALERCAAESTSEATVSTVELPSDDMKGRIIGREGRNIRSFEQATGVDVIVDDTPGVVVLSSFDSVRRETARVAMERLVADGRIHPGRIEEMTEKASEEVQGIIRETGKEAAYDMGLPSIPDQLKELIGRLKFRTSFGQNVLQHSIEVGQLAGIMAAEVNLDPQIARRCGLLHDIGKAMDHEHEGSHAVIGAEEARRWGESEGVVNAIEAHHEDVEPTNLYAGLILAADTMSASRPGARRETLERYIKRLERLENLATSYGGVHTAYAIQAGREVRVLVNSDKVNDKTAAKLSRDIAREVQKELQYPGEVQITVIRESRYSEVAH
ncbi:MAG: ribonuclease Y [Candidatus Brocadiia bacterium]